MQLLFSNCRRFNGESDPNTALAQKLVATIVRLIKDDPPHEDGFPSSMSRESELTSGNRSSVVKATPDKMLGRRQRSFTNESNNEFHSSWNRELETEKIVDRSVRRFPLRSCRNTVIRNAGFLVDDPASSLPLTSDSDVDDDSDDRQFRHEGNKSFPSGTRSSVRLSSREHPVEQVKRYATRSRTNHDNDH